MKTVSLLGLSFALSATFIARAKIPDTAVPNLTITHRTNLIDIDQSQTFETLSMADEFIRLPVSSYKTAGVYFITNKKGQVFGSAGNGRTGFEDTTGKQCEDLGYKLTSCSSGSPLDVCPYNSAYFKSCCDASYKYNSSTVCPSPLTLSADSCGGKYKCECPSSTYSFSTCSDFMLTGESCVDDSGTHYACSCPTGVEAPLGCKDYYAAPCGYVCKEPYEDTCHLYEGKGVKAPYGCEEYFEGCDTICKTAYADNCRKYEDALDSCPKGATCSYYSDCSSKVQSFTCKTNFEKTENACLLPLPVLYGDTEKTVSRELLDGKTPIAVVSDETNHVAVALTDINASGSAGTSEIKWANTKYDIPDLVNCDIDDYDKSLVFTCGVNGRDNTDKILACGSSCGGTPAATATNSYQPSSGCAADFCKKTNWFLPSAYDLNEVYKVKGKMNSTLSLLGGFGAKKLSDVRYWSSTGMNIMYSWSLSFSDGHVLSGDKTKATSKYVRPVIRYGEANYADTYEGCALAEAAIETCPMVANCSYFDSCPSKIRSWSCPSGMVKTSDDCLWPFPILYGDGTVYKGTLSTKIADKTPIGIVFDEDKKLAVALTDVKSDGTPGSERMKWSEYGCIVGMEDISSCSPSGTITLDQGADEVITCGGDGRQNTKDILATCDNPDAAIAATSYQPAGCTADFCKVGNWFLPSMSELQGINFADKKNFNDSGQLEKNGHHNMYSLMWTSAFLSKLGAERPSDDHVSSNEKEKDAWTYYMGGYGYSRKTWSKSYTMGFVRPILKYQD